VKAKARPTARRRRREEETHVQSATAVAAEALRTGVLPRRNLARRRNDVPAPESDIVRVGDPDDDSMSNEYVGDQTPGGSSPTPDQSVVDEIGRAYGLQDEDSGPLRSATEVLNKRDRRRPQLEPPPDGRTDR
jgi:hypothetical protein